ncbi:O-antigen/teichoic acid export membrane protein [Paenochrobactrum gallinarii]|uniref:O-antigen/teichoic acid export membrane protein n=2 Tax=Paenochrobactrum gallinarii TaxID=643673 RepID=A0A841M2I9_9HYPH|nr:O-antigen/teichoic acid export membrane protein [Paenochrobactrum gallinarii]
MKFGVSLQKLKQSISPAVMRDYFALISGSLGRLVVSLIYFIALANSLSLADFGLFATASAAGVVLSRLVALGFNSPLYRIATVKPHLLGAYTAGYLLSILASIPLFALATIGAYLIFFKDNVSFWPFAIIVIAEALVWRSAEIIIIVNNGLGRFGRGSFLTIAGTAARSAAAFLFAFTSAKDISHWAWWYLGANVFSLLLALQFYPKVRLRLRPKLYVRRIADSLSVTAAEFLFYLQNEFDKLLVLSFGGPTIAGIYAIIMRLVDLTAVPIRSFNMMLVQKLMRKPDLLTSAKIKLSMEGGIFAISTIALGGLAAVLYIFPNALGSNVAPVAGLVPLVLLVPGLRNLIEYQNELLYARGQSGLRAINLSVTALIKALLIWLLLRSNHDGNDWIIWLNACFVVLYLFSACFTYWHLRKPANRI